MASYSVLFLFLLYFLDLNVFCSAGSAALLLCTDEYCSRLAECGTTSTYCAINNETYSGKWMLSPSTCNCCDFCLPFYQEGIPCSTGGTGTGTTVGRCGSGLTCVEEDAGAAYCRRMQTPCHSAQDEYDLRLAAGTLGYLEERPECDDQGNYMPYTCVMMQSCFCQSDSGERIFGEVAYPGFGPGTKNVMSCGCSRFYEKIKSNLSPRLPHPAVAPRCTSDGDFNPIQCIDKTCYCVDTVTGLVKGTEKVNLDEEPISELSCYKKENDAYAQFNAADEPPYEYTTPCLLEIKERMELIQESERDGYNIDYFASVPECLPDGSHGRISLNSNGSKICVDERGLQIGDYIAEPDTAEFDQMDCKCAQTSLLLSNSPEAPICCKNGNFRPVQCRRGMCRCVDSDGRQTVIENSDITRLSCYTQNWRDC